MFDGLGGLILGYASEIWGYTKSKEKERIHLKFCKNKLKVKISCSDAVLESMMNYVAILYMFHDM